MLVKLYSNKNEFSTICFKSGLNVVLGEIRLAEDKNKDTHNLGKSTLCQLIDFCLLKTRNKNAFPFNHLDLFIDYVFYLEIELPDGRYLTIRRDVNDSSKIWLYVSNERGVDARKLAEDEWTHKRLDFERARTLLDGYLAYESLRPFKYRKVLGYLLRSQSDFNQVFKVAKFKGKDRDWKPFVIQIMGFDRKPFEHKYELEDEAKRLEAEEGRLLKTLADGLDDAGDLDALIAIKQREVDSLQSFLDDFKLEPSDQSAVKELVEDIDETIGELNDRRYELRYSINQIEHSLEKEQLLFSTAEAEDLFKEAGVLFEGQLKRSFEQLLEFNRDITEERRSYLIKDLEAAKSELKTLESDLRALDTRRSTLLNQLSSRDVVVKYKGATNELVLRRTELEELKRRRARVRELQDIRREKSKNTAELMQCGTNMQDELARVSGQSACTLFTNLRDAFDEIVYKVINQHGLLSVSINSNGNAEFKADIVGANGISTNQGEGETYKKLLCIAFDLALLLAHESKGFPTFVFHDDVLSGLDKRKKENLRDIMRNCADRGVQQIVTVIDSDLPDAAFFQDAEIIHRLHDDGIDGRLFKIPEW